MCWKKLPRWFKCGVFGGIIGFVISFIILVLNHFYLLSVNTIADCYDPVIRKSVACYSKPFFDAVFYNPFLYIFIIIGILIGLVYGFLHGKKKKKKK
jgi:hypothetical protein